MKRSLRLLPIVLTALFCIASASAGGRFQRVGIMTATAPELAPFLKVLRLDSKEEYAGRTFYRGQIEGSDAVLVQGGVGKTNAAITTTILLAKYNVDLLLFSGVGGGIHESLAIGDVVVSSRVVNGDYIKIAKGKAESMPIKRLDHDGFHQATFLHPPKALLDIAVKAGKKSDLTKVFPLISSRPRVYAGTICTQDAFVADKKQHRWLRQTFKGAISEMEGAAMAQAARAVGVPWLVFRGVSDLTNAASGIIYPLSRKKSARNAALVTLNTLFDLQGTDPGVNWQLPTDNTAPPEAQEEQQVPVSPPQPVEPPQSTETEDSFTGGMFPQIEDVPPGSEYTISDDSGTY